MILFSCNTSTSEPESFIKQMMDSPKDLKINLLEQKIKPTKYFYELINNKNIDNFQNFFTNWKQDYGYEINKIYEDSNEILFNVSDLSKKLTIDMEYYIQVQFLKVDDQLWINGIVFPDFIDSRYNKR